MNLYLLMNLDFAGGGAAVAATLLADRQLYPSRPSHRYKNLMSRPRHIASMLALLLWGMS